MKSAHDAAGRPAEPQVLEVRHLRLVRAIADAGGATRAAGVLHLSQSAVSHQLLDLERQLGARLFDRVGKRMVPTPTGAQLAAAAGRLLGELADLECAVDRTRDARIPLRITSSCYTSYHWLPAALALFGEHHKHVELDIVLEATRRAVPALIADEVDFAIVTDPPSDPTWMREQVVASELVAVASPSHPICERVQRGALRWGALHDCAILVPDIADTDLVRLDRAVRVSRQRESGQPVTHPLVVRRIPVSEALHELARSGAGVAIVDRWTIVSRLGADLVALPLVPQAPRVFHAVWRRANPRGLPLADLVAILKASAARATRPPPARTRRKR